MQMHTAPTTDAAHPSNAASILPCVQPDRSQAPDHPPTPPLPLPLQQKDRKNVRLAIGDRTGTAGTSATAAAAAGTASLATAAGSGATAAAAAALSADRCFFFLDDEPPSAAESALRRFSPMAGGGRVGNTNRVRRTKKKKTQWAGAGRWATEVTTQRSSPARRFTGKNRGAA